MQLRNDDRLSEDNFLKLMIESYKRLPLLRAKMNRMTCRRNRQSEKIESLGTF